MELYHRLFYQTGHLTAFLLELEKISNDKGVPSETIKVLEKIYYSNLARNMLLYDELSKVLSAFKTAEIDVIVLKGVFLAEQIYKNIGLRPMSDIDLLVKEKDLQKAKVELNKLMYYPTIIFPTQLHEQFQTLLYEELPFINQGKKFLLKSIGIFNPGELLIKLTLINFGIMPYRSR